MVDFAKHHWSRAALTGYHQNHLRLKVAELWDDQDLFRSTAFNAKGDLVNARRLDQSIRRRLQVISKIQDFMIVLADVEYMTQFYGALTDVVLSGTRDQAIEMMKRLDAIREATGDA